MDPAHEDLRAKAVAAIEALRVDAIRLSGELRNNASASYRYAVDAIVCARAKDTIEARAHK